MDRVWDIALEGVETPLHDAMPPPTDHVALSVKTVSALAVTIMDG